MTKEITLLRGEVVVVDDKDFTALSGYKWYLNGGYARRADRVDGKRVIIAMHREIMAAPRGRQVDHINGDPLDNRRANLRICRPEENRLNRKRHKNGRSGFKGVYRNTDGKHEGHPWTAQLAVNGKRVWIGRFATPEAAARAYDTAARRHHGEFARTNAALGLL